MSDARRSTSEIERTRSDVDNTIHELKDRFSPDAAFEYGASYMRGPGGQRLLGAVRENPLAAVIALAGIGWLLYTASQPKSDRRGASETDGGRRIGADWQRSQGGSRPGVMGDWTEEQNLNQPGDPTARITRQEVEAAFGQEQGPGDLTR